ncbi:hypothetical protein [Amycolatopsis sp. NPDC052450]
MRSDRVIQLRRARTVAIDDADRRPEKPTYPGLVFHHRRGGLLVDKV